MKKIKLLSLFVLSLLVLSACSSDDTPDPVLEEEVITTMTVTLTPNGGGTAITLKKQDLDGDGPNAPVLTVTGGDLAAGVTYTGSIELLNETESPAEDITEEVEELSDEHQFFFTVTGGLDVTTDYTNFDGDNNPLGTEFTLTAGAASSGTITFTLRHEPKKPNDGTLADAAGETDIDATFNIAVN